MIELVLNESKLSDSSNACYFYKDYLILYEGERQPLSIYIVYFLSSELFHRCELDLDAAE